MFLACLLPSTPTKIGIEDRAFKDQLLGCTDETSPLVSLTEHRYKSRSWKLSGNLQGSEHLANKTKGQLACKGLEGLSFARSTTHLIVFVSIPQSFFPYVNLSQLILPRLLLLFYKEKSKESKSF